MTAITDALIGRARGVMTDDDVQAVTSAVLLAAREDLGLAPRVAIQVIGDHPSTTRPPKPPEQ